MTKKTIYTLRRDSYKKGKHVKSEWLSKVGYTCVWIDEMTTDCFMYDLDEAKKLQRSDDMQKSIIEVYKMTMEKIKELV